VGSLDSREIKRIVTAQSNAVYAPPGFVLFAREGTLMAQRFDIGTLAASGDPFAVAPGIGHNRASAEGSFHVSANGQVVAYLEAVNHNSRLTWFDHAGRNIGTIGPEADFTVDMQIAPDGRQA